MQPRIKVWVVFGDRTQLGDGRARLFELIDELGSIKKAARMGMSYRAAWGYIRELEAAAGFRFLERTPGGGGTGGAFLTREARAFPDPLPAIPRDPRSTGRPALHPRLRGRFLARLQIREGPGSHTRISPLPSPDVSPVNRW